MQRAIDQIITLPFSIFIHTKYKFSKADPFFLFAVQYFYFLDIPALTRLLDMNTDSTTSFEPLITPESFAKSLIEDEQRKKE